MNKETCFRLIKAAEQHVAAIERELYQLRTYELIERMPGEKSAEDDLIRRYTVDGQKVEERYRKVYFNRTDKEMSRIIVLMGEKHKYSNIKDKLMARLKELNTPAPYIPSEEEVQEKLAIVEERKPDIENWLKAPEPRDIEVKVPFEEGHLVLKMTEKEKDKFDLLMHKLATDDIRLAEKEIREHKLLLAHIKEEEREAKRIATKKLIEDYNYIVSLPKPAREEIYATKAVNAVLEEMEKTNSISPNCKMCRERFGITDQHRCDVCAKARERILEKILNSKVNPEIHRPMPVIDNMSLDDYTKGELLARYRKVDTGVRITWEKIEDDGPKKTRWFLKGLTKYQQEERLNWLCLMVRAFWESYPGLEEYRDAIVKMKSILATARIKMKEDIHCNMSNVFKKYIEPLVEAKLGIAKNPWTKAMVEISYEEKESFYDNKKVLVKVDDNGKEHYFVPKHVSKCETVSLEAQFNDFNHADEGRQEGILRGMAYYSECPYMENGWLMESFIKYYKMYGRPYMDILTAYKDRHNKNTTSYSKFWVQEKLKDFFLGAIGFLGLDKEDFFFQTVNGDCWFKTRKALEFYGYLDFLSRAMERKECTSIKKFFEVKDNSVEEYFKKYSITSELMG